MDTGKLDFQPRQRDVPSWDLLNHEARVGIKRETFRKK